MTTHHIPPSLYGIPTPEEFAELGARDPLAQDRWCQARDAELGKLWHCACGARLPKRGRLWRHRFDRWLLDQRLNADAYCGYRCDACADAYEAGRD